MYNRGGGSDGGGGEGRRRGGSGYANGDSSGFGSSAGASVRSAVGYGGIRAKDETKRAIVDHNNSILRDIEVMFMLVLAEPVVNIVKSVFLVLLLFIKKK